MSNLSLLVKSKERITDPKANVKGTNRPVDPGLSLRNGPVEDPKTHKPIKANGVVNGKRKAAVGGNYKELSDSEEDEVPLVGWQCFTPRALT